MVEPPPGGPLDTVRPHLVFMIPDSASTGLGEVIELNLTFSEKMERKPAVTWLHFFPDQRIRDTRWHGAIRADIVLEQPLPPDTVIVVEIAAGMKDAHKVSNRRSRRFPIATGDSIPTGRITGVLVMADSAVTNGVVELYAVPPDTLEYFEQPLLRRTVTDQTGTYVFDWLPVPGGPWLLRGFADGNGDLRPGEKEAQRLLPDTLSLADNNPQLAAGVVTLYPPNTPGRLLVGPFAAADFPGLTMAWTARITENDTGWVPAPVSTGNFAVLDPAGGSPISEVAPGANRLFVFVDVDGDSTFSGVADSLLGRSLAWPDSAAGDSVATHFLEPWLMTEGLEVLPGLDTSVELPGTAYSLTPWTPPAPTPGDSLAAALADSLVGDSAVADSTAAGAEPPAEGEGP